MQWKGSSRVVAVLDMESAQRVHQPCDFQGGIVFLLEHHADLIELAGYTGLAIRF